MRRNALVRILTLVLAFVHTFPARKHLGAFLQKPSFSDGWEGFGALAAIVLCLLPVGIQIRAIAVLWRKRRAVARAGGVLLAVAHAVPASDHLPRFLESGSWSDAWRGLGSGLAMVWFLAPLSLQARVIAALARVARPSAAPARASQLLEREVDQLDANRTLADRGGHPLDAGRAHIADTEHVGDAGLHQIGSPRQRPLGARQIFRG
jgi:hypothetical protein